MKLLEKYGKKKLWIAGIGSLIAVVCIGGGIWYTMELNYKNNILDSIDITFKEEAYIEYGQEDINYDTFIKEKVGEPTIQLPENKIDSKELGTKEVVYILSKYGYSKEKTLSLEIKDTKAPEIKFKEDTVTIDYGAEFDIKSNIESVKDPVDGDVPYADIGGENNYYIIEGAFDSSEVGDHKITVKAVDKNGQKSEKSYTVHVNDEAVEEQVNAAPKNTGGGYVAPVSGNQSGGSNTPSGGGSSGGGNTCVSNGSYSPIGNSGRIFDSESAARDYADGEIYNENSPWFMYGYMPGTASDNCGNQKWTINFYK